MALINCPECNREISDKAVTCPHCGYPLNIGNESSSISQTANSYAVIFYKINGNKTEIIKKIKEVMNISLYDAKTKVDNFPSILSRNISLNEGNRIKTEIEKLGADIILLPDDSHKSDADIIKPYKSDTVCCPRCSSTSITTGQRGFSLLTGFIGSNKTVNRCAKCGYTWEP